jgi:septum site-determining protein MinC
MTDKVKVKSFQNGIILELNEDADFEDIVIETQDKFRAGKNFFGHTAVALSIIGREVTDAQEIRLIDAITSNSNVSVVCVVGHDEETDKNFIKALRQVEKKLSSGGGCSLYRGTLKDGDILQTEGDAVIVGNVNPGCTVSVTGSIVVFGGLYGTAHAGKDGREGAYITALEMEPEKLKIGDFKYRSKDKKSKWGIHPKIQPKIAYIKDERVVVEPLTKELPTE